MDEILCPECGEPLEVDAGWDFMEDNGDHIVCRTVVECECGREVCVEAYFNWDGMYKVD